MSERRPIVVSLLSAAVVAGLALLLRPAEQGRSGQSAVPPAERGAALRSELHHRVERSAVDEDPRLAAREDADAEPGPSPGTLRRYAAIEPEVTPLARRFFAAFSRYELGEVDRRVLASLRSTSSEVFARELLRAPPRLPSSGAPPARASLAQLELVPRDAAHGRIVTVELVGLSRRGAARAPIAIELARERGAWLVAGLGA